MPSIQYKIHIRSKNIDITQTCDRQPNKRMRSITPHIVMRVCIRFLWILLFVLITLWARAAWNRFPHEQKRQLLFHFGRFQCCAILNNTCNYYDKICRQRLKGLDDNIKCRAWRVIDTQAHVTKNNEVNHSPLMKYRNRCNATATFPLLLHQIPHSTLHEENVRHTLW